MGRRSGCAAPALRPTVIRHRSRPLRRIPAFIDTGFARRLRKHIEDAHETREWVILLGLPGDGKTWAYRQFLADHPVRRFEGRLRTDVLACRIPQGGVSSNGLMYALGRRVGLTMPGRPFAYY